MKVSVRRSSGVRVAALIALLGLAPVCVALAQVTAYRIGPKDLLEIEVFEAPEFNTEVRIADDGMFSLPIIGEIPANGLSEEELARRLATRLEECCVQRATVSIHVREYRARPITVIGAVTRPGNLSFAGRLTLIEVLTGAGGLASQHGDVIYVLRRVDSGLSDQLEIRLDDLLVRGEQRLNIPIYAGDLINVPSTTEVTVFLLGEVARPGAHGFRSTERITLLTAVARAGGMTDRASRRIVIKRETDSGETRAIEVDYKRILSGKDDDIELEAGDIVVVKESFF